MDGLYTVSTRFPGCTLHVVCEFHTIYKLYDLLHGFKLFNFSPDDRRASLFFSSSRISSARNCEHWRTRTNRWLRKRFTQAAVPHLHSLDRWATRFLERAVVTESCGSRTLRHCSLWGLQNVTGCLFTDYTRPTTCAQFEPVASAGHSEVSETSAAWAPFSHSSLSRNSGNLDQCTIC